MRRWQNNSQRGIVVAADRLKRFSHLSDDDRQNILQILRENQAILGFARADALNTLTAEFQNKVLRTRPLDTQSCSHPLILEGYSRVCG